MPAWRVPIALTQACRVTASRRPVSTVVGVGTGVKTLIVVAAVDETEPKPLIATQSRLRTLRRKAARQSGLYDQQSKSRRQPSSRWRGTQTRAEPGSARQRTGGKSGSRWSTRPSGPAPALVALTGGIRHRHNVSAAPDKKTGTDAVRAQVRMRALRTSH